MKRAMRIRARWSSVSASQRARLNEIVARVATLLTFWPPGPPLVVKVKRRSRSGMERSGLMRIVDMSGEYNSCRASRKDVGGCGDPVAEVGVIVCVEEVIPGIFALPG